MSYGSIQRISELPDIKKCPFCGGTAHHSYNGEFRYVRCRKCGARGKEFDVTKEIGNNLDTLDKAIRAWNERYEVDPE